MGFLLMKEIQRAEREGNREEVVRLLAEKHGLERNNMKASLFSTFDGTKYSEKLCDPRWVETRDMILGRDKNKCRVCNDGDSELHVHHRKYTGEPWEAPNCDLITLCKKCHEYAHGKGVS